ncbi:acetyl-CoA acetyltransferase [Mycolicibacterium helvum]|uniref:Acetyl-CoA acetyltransferase n=1 Tax=Mycolicibacterium helvum TaxID=1534349 RepID=A0A7I7T921_9MYCO|nr:acetyl-CoA acetyltransferase [Mycolicibacterium helvum]BBY64959.1 acetyl-CoA acetyltransferase [Mycolicibacterium helvum]
MVDPRTPVIVGVGQFTERIDDPDYRGMSSVELATEAVRAALADTGADVAAVAKAIEVFAGLRQFEICTPFASAPLGCSDNYIRSVAQRVGANPARAVLEPIGGNGPQKLVSEFGGAIAAGDIEVALILGSENGSTLKTFAGRDQKPDHSETVGGQLDDRGYGFEQYMSEYTANHGLTGAPVQYGLLDNARRKRLGLGVDEYRRQMAELFAPFSKVAAKNPFSSSPIERSVEELATVSAENRMICDPYPRLMVARDTVNQGAAALIMSVEAARKLGVAEEKWVYLHGHADQREQDLLDREDVSVSYSSKQAVAEALRGTGIGIDDVATFDLYSCFPFPVFAVCDDFGLAADDPRGLTLTGGLPYFGGPGNNYSLHGIAETVVAMRDKPGAFGLVGANGGVMSKYSVGVYSTTPTDWVPDRSKELQADIAALPKVAVTRNANGAGVIETYSVRYDWPVRTGVIIGRLAADNSRFLALAEEPELVSLLSDGDPLNVKITVRSIDSGNRATLH